MCADHDNKHTMLNTPTNNMNATLLLLQRPAESFSSRYPHHPFDMHRSTKPENGDKNKVKDDGRRRMREQENKREQERTRENEKEREEEAEGGKKKCFNTNKHKILRFLPFAFNSASLGS